MDDYTKLFKDEEELKEAFESYEKCRQVGSFNMLDLRLGIESTGLTQEQYVYIIMNYSGLMEKFPEVRR